ncbi:MAG TPA: efflux RND transporter permease subunit [Rhizomicrobium sp.]|nr:efflux RND transporter permease subunit [Rhizomicrobium sp.]
MNISAPFIARPIATTLVTIGLALAGFVAFFLLPVSPMPDVDIPAIFVQATMAGASPETMATSVATPLERHLGAIADVDEMTSQSSVGSTRVILTFDINRNIDGAARDVEAAINAARADLPTSLRSNPTYRKLNPADAPILIMALTSDTLSPGQMYDSASTILQQKLSQVSGIGQVQIGGSSLPSVRVDLNPAALFKYGIGLEDVRAALSGTNANAPKGLIDQHGRSLQLYTNDQQTRADQFAPLVIAYRNGDPVRLSDIAHVYDGVENVFNLGVSNGKPAILVILYKQPGANIIQTVDRVKALLPQLQASIPPAIHIEVANDRTGAIRKSLGDVERSLIVSVLLVIAVVFLFLRDVRATLIPSVAVPLSLLATFGIMYLLGFSLNNLSLMALTVATGFVIDDAIVVLENITRHIEDGMPKMEAVATGAREVGFTVVSMSLSLIAVFVPILLMGGLVGEFFRQFAVTLGASIMVSLIVSLTTTPMLCRYLTERKPAHEQNRWLQRLELVFDRARDVYDRALLWSLKYPGTIMMILLVTIGLNFYLLYKVPKDFLPNEDTGDLFGNIVADQSISFQAMKQKFTQFVDIIKQDPAVENVVGFTGGGGGGPRGGATNTGSVFVQLKPIGQRKASTDQVRERIGKNLLKIVGARLFLQGAQDFRAGGRQGNAQYQYTLLGDTLEDLNTWVPKITAALQNVPELQDVNSDQQSHGLEVELAIDRQTAARLGISVSQIDATLYDAFGQRTVSTIYKDTNQYYVVMGVAPQFWQNPDTLNDIYISTTGGPASGTQSTNAVVGTTLVTAGAAAASSTTPTAAQIAADSVRNLQLNSIATSSRGASSGASVSTAQETMVPLSAVAHYAPGNTPLTVNHQGPFVATTFSFNLPPGAALGPATQAIQRTMQQLHVPISITGGFAGNAKLFTQSLSSEPLLLLAAIVSIYIVLGVLYESYVHPLTILSTIPSAGVGATLALIITGTTFTLLALIGVLLLIGIVKKNAIMMIDFALEAERTRGLTSREAIYLACLMRFRPIMMTTFAAILGALPLALGFGTTFSQSLGISIVGGLIVSQALTLFTTPIVYIYMDGFRLRCRRMWQRWYLGVMGDPEAHTGPAE